RARARRPRGGPRRPPRAARRLRGARAALLRGDGGAHAAPPPGSACDPRPRGRMLRREPMQDPQAAPAAPPSWKTVKEYRDIRYERSEEGIAKITISRPEVRNAFRPETVMELLDAFGAAKDDLGVGVVLFTGEGPEAFCSGGDQRVRGSDGYVGED